MTPIFLDPRKGSRKVGELGHILPGEHDAAGGWFVPPRGESHHDHAKHEPGGIDLFGSTSMSVLKNKPFSKHFFH